MIAVMGATGNTGKKIALSLLELGEQVRALGRSEERLAELARAGAEVRAGDAYDPAFLARALAGAEAAYVLVATDRAAPDYRASQEREGEAVARALRASGVGRVVALSSLGADRPEGTGLIAGLHAQEARLRGLGAARLHLLRPASFFENFRGALEGIRYQGVNADSVIPDLPIPMVASRDIAAAAVQALRDRGARGTSVQELLGPRDLSMREATRLLGVRIGQPDLAYVQLSYDDMAGALVQAGMSPSFGRLYAEMTRAFNEGRVGPREGRGPANTTPTRFEEFAAELGRGYRAAA